MKSFHRILFAADFSSGSEKAFDEAIQMAKGNEAELVIANAYQPPSFLPTDIYLSPAVYDELDSKLRENVEKKLQGLVEDARKRGVEARPLVLAGSPYEAIAEAAGTHRADLIVMELTAGPAYRVSFSAASPRA